MKVNPKSPVLVRARFTLGQGPGSFDGTPTWRLDGPGTIVAQRDDPAAGTTEIDVDGSTAVTGDTTNFHVEADADKGTGVQTLAADSTDDAEWDTGQQIVADAVVFEMSQA